MGGEFKTKGVHVALGPVVGPLGRVAESGRNWEGISNDRESLVFSICARVDLMSVYLCSISVRFSCRRNSPGGPGRRGDDLGQTLHRK